MSTPKVSIKHETESARYNNKTLASQTARLNVLVEMNGALVGEFNPARVAESALNHLCPLFQSFKGSVVEVNGAKKRHLAYFGITKEQQRILERFEREKDSNWGLIQCVVDSQQVLVIDDIGQHPHWRPVKGWDDDVQSTVVIPLIIDEVLVGVISLHNKLSNHHILKEDIPFLLAALQPVGSALHAARLYESMRYQKTLLECQSEASPDGMLVSYEGKWLTHNRHFIDMWQIPGPIAARGSTAEAVEAILPMMADPEQFSARIDYLYANPKESSSDEIHLKDGRVFARFTTPIDNESGHHGRAWFFYDITEQKQLEAELTREKKRLEKMYLLSRKMDITKPPNEVAQRAIDILCPLFEAFKGAVITVDKTTGWMNHIAAFGFDKEQLEANEKSGVYRIGRGLCGWVAEHRRPLVIPDLTKDDRWMPVIPLDDGIGSSVTLPLESNGELIGVLNLSSDRINTFLNEHVPFLTAAVRPVADALHQAQLHDALQESETRFRQLADHMDEAFWIINWDERRILYVSPAYENIWMRSVTSLYQSFQNWIEAIHPEDRERVEQICASYVSTKAIHFEYRIIRPDGTIRWIHNRCITVRDDSRQTVRLMGIAEDITARNAASDRLVKYQQQLRSLNTRITLVEEQERRRLAGELHDSIGQSLAMLKIKMGGLDYPGISHDVETSIREMQLMLDEVILQTRSLTMQLSPPVLYELGFEAAVGWLAEHMTAQYGVMFTLHNTVRDRLPMAEEVATLLFTAVKELMFNVVKHAKVERSTISIRQIEHRVRLDLIDNGIGFNPLKNNGGFGLFNIRERLHHIDGAIAIRSGTGQGTHITLDIPLTGGNHNGHNDHSG